MAGERVLVVDDDPGVRNQVRSILAHNGFTVLTAASGPEALQTVDAAQPALVVLDITLSGEDFSSMEPPMDGIEVLRRLRSRPGLCVLMLSSTGAEIVKVLALSIGADDYLTKPFSGEELAARVKAILRRRALGDAPSEGPPLVFGALRIDQGARQAWRGQSLLDLTPTEYGLLVALARNPGRVLSREQLMEQAWPRGGASDERTVDVHIGRLRKKLEADPDAPQFITTVRGAGYRLERE